MASLRRPRSSLRSCAVESCIKSPIASIYTSETCITSNLSLYMYPSEMMIMTMMMIDEDDNVDVDEDDNVDVDDDDDDDDDTFTVYFLPVPSPYPRTDRGATPPGTMCFALS